MKYRYVGKSGLLVSRVALGTMTFGAPKWGCDEKTAHEMIDLYRQSGGNVIDTANNYAGSRSEEIIGSYLCRMNRDEIVVASKCFFPQGAVPGSYGLSRKHIIQACNDSLQRLQTDYLDLYFIHAFDPYTPLEETMDALNSLVQHGKVRYIGCSNLYAWQFTMANGIAAKRDNEQFICGQHMYNLIHRDIEHDVVPACEAQGMSLFAWSPLGGGMLTGKYRPAQDPEEGTRMHFRRNVDGPRFWHDHAFHVASQLLEVEATTGIDRAQLALGWILRNRSVASVILGARSTDQLRENLKVSDWDMGDDVYADLTSRTEPQANYLTQFARHSHNAVFTAHEIG